MRRLFVLLLSFVLISAMPACGRDDESLNPFGHNDSKLSDPRYVIIEIGAFNYTDYDIYNVYLLPPDKDSLDYAAHGEGERATRPNAAYWSGGGGESPGMAWNLHWTTPKKFKVWWFRVVDEKAFAASNHFDKYANKNTDPGAAWCEGEITVTRPPEKDASNSIVLHFYPDGRVEGDMDTYRPWHRQSVPKVDIAKRNEQPKLTGRACLKEIANPFYGRKKPISIQ